MFSVSKSTIYEEIIVLLTIVAVEGLCFVLTGSAYRAVSATIAQTVSMEHAGNAEKDTPQWRTPSVRVQIIKTLFIFIIESFHSGKLKQL